MARRRTVAVVTGVAAATVGILTVPWQALADQVIADDLIVQGSACVGFDCVNGESFGFDTIRLKENNLRINFDDTSNSASFPANDWQITINDSSNGGANKFSIDDISGARTPFTILAGARTNSIFVNSSGKVGFGTATPLVDLHNKTGNTPTLRLEQDGTSGFTAQTWDLAGNESNFFIRDVTNGSKLPFRIRPGAPTSSIDIAASGNVGIGNTSPSAPLHVKTTTLAGNDPILKLDRTTAGESALEFDGSLTNDTWRFNVAADGSSFRITKVGSGTTEFLVRDNGVITFRTSNAAPTTTPIRGDVYIDRSGGFCVAFTANVWTNVANSGDCI